MSGHQSRRVPHSPLRELVTRILQKYEMPLEDARIAANHLIASNLRGVDTHGVIRLKGYIQRIQAGGNNPKPNIRIVEQTDTTAVMDGDNSVGQVGGQKAMDLAIEKARKSGVGIVAMRNSNHYGMAAFYSMMPLPSDMIGISMSNVLACMAPTGGAAGRFGNNPISIAFPAGQEPPVVVDFATSKSSWGKALLCKQTGDPLPEGCFMDNQGNPTLSAEAFLDGGTLIPIADHKGYGIALSISLLCGLLADGVFDTEIPHLYKKLGEAGANSFIMAALKIENFQPVSRFKKRMDDIIRIIHSTPLAPGMSRIFLPGEMEHEREMDNLRNGIPLNDEMIVELISLSKNAQIPTADYEFLENVISAAAVSK